MDFKDKKALVCGIAKSGISAAVLLNELGADVTVQDIKDPVKLDLQFLTDRGIKLYLGKNPDDIVSEQDIIVVSPGIPCDLPFFAEAERLGVKVIGEIELAYRLCKPKIAAITGSNGKTTTTALTGKIMSAEIVGNIGIPFTERVRSLDADGFVVAEISSFQLETVSSFQPKISAVLNVTPDHLNRHKSFENYLAMKERIFKNQNESDFLVLNYDDKLCRKMAEKTKARVIFFSVAESLDEGVFLSGAGRPLRGLLAHASGKDIILRMGGEDIKIISTSELKILGSHNIANAMAAIAIAYAAGTDTDRIREGLRDFEPLPHRMEYVTTINDIEFYNDSKGTNADCAIKSIEAMPRPIVLIGGGYDKGADFGDWVKAFGGRVKRLIVLGEVADKIIDTCRTYNFENFDKVNSLRDAVELAYAKAAPGDCVLLSPACASWDMFENYEQRGNMFKQFVNDLR